MASELTDTFTVSIMRSAFVISCFYGGIHIVNHAESLLNKIIGTLIIVIFGIAWLAMAIPL